MMAMRIATTIKQPATVPMTMPAISPLDRWLLDEVATVAGGGGETFAVVTSPPTKICPKELPNTLVAFCALQQDNQRHEIPRYD